MLDAVVAVEDAGERMKKMDRAQVDAQSAETERTRAEAAKLRAEARLIEAEAMAMERRVGFTPKADT